MKAYLVFVGALFLIFGNAKAKGSNDFDIERMMSKETIAHCADVFGNPKLEAIRGKFPLAPFEETTNVMRSDESVPTKGERKAFETYLLAYVSCYRLGSVVTYGDDKAAKKANDARLLGDERAKLLPLLKGEATYGSYIRANEATNKVAAEAVVSSIKAKFGYQAQIAAWLEPFKPNYPVDSPWWLFFKDAIKYAKDADEGNITIDEAKTKIEARRLQFNNLIINTSTNNVTGQPVILNCIVESASRPQHVDFPIKIDYAMSTVNNYVAQFSETTIQWSRPEKNGSHTVDTILNRLSGGVVVKNDEVGVIFTGTCAPAKAQF